MKIGILTHHYINNFGAFLQTYALQEAVKELYPNDEVYVINAINMKHFIINTCGWFRFYKNRENIKSWIQKIQLPITFYKARQKYLNLTRRCFNTAAINNLKLDCIIVGSDEVWNYKESKGNAEVKFGQGLQCNNIVAYAPSVGKSEYNGTEPEYINKGLEKFKAISSRDDLTEEFVDGILGYKPPRVLDPTFLSHFPEEEYSGLNKPYVLFYYCDGMSKKLKNEIIEKAHKQGYAVYGAGESDKKYTDITVNLTPFEWVTMFKNAKYVFTGTFHGAVFSILSQKQFQIYMTNESRIKKISSLLEQFEINKDDIDLNSGVTLFDNKINYEIVNEKIKMLKENSKSYLLNNLR